MEVSLTVTVSMPDAELQKTIDALDDDGSLEDETLESVFWTNIKDWLDPSYIHVAMKAEVHGISNPNYNRLLGESG